MDWMERLAEDVRTAEEKKKLLMELARSQETTLGVLKKQRGQIQREIARKEVLLLSIDERLRDVTQSQYDTEQALKPVHRTIDLYVLSYNNLRWLTDLSSKQLHQRGRPIDLMKFPKEIRLMIFQFLLVKHNSIEPAKRPRSSRSSEIFRVRKEIRDEAYKVFYGFNTFKINPMFSNFTSLYFSVTHRLPYLAYLRHVKLCIGWEINIVDIFEWLRHCTGLISLAVRLILFQATEEAINRMCLSL